MNLLVSACLLGVNCRYNGTGCANDKVLELRKQHNLIPVCPEQLGGLPTPRDPVELANGRAVTCNGADRTMQFSLGAQETLRLARLFNCSAAILKTRSPSCGFGKIYDGSFSGTLTNGNGITAEKLIQAKIPVYNEENCDQIPSGSVLDIPK
ncbi:MAG: DUF523 domain-containing protein [Oscillospiraceae bacterium]